MREETDLVVGGGRRVGDRCIIPIVRTFAICMEGAATVSLTPVALLVTEGELEYLTLLPDAPAKTGDTIGTLRDAIEREKKKCAG
ncbi:hypothetical protein [Methanoculleus oceani]|uniref:hypothetical protein n=1 Tax=Methanoculleus oceani TaxID=2184756 RepID=UPI002033E235|nr:hypothetical protein [Methanoculleus sp. CWC-02]